MSEPTEIHRFKPAPPKILAMTADQFDRLIADTRRETVEECCKIICEDCSQGLPLIILEGYWLHQTPSGKVWMCKADTTRRLLAKDK